MPGTQELTRRIKSVKSTRKITRAMQMVSAAKMRKAQVAALNSRTYSELAWELISKLRANASERSNLLKEQTASSDALLAVSDIMRLMENNPKATKIAVVVISTNKGLVGSFNVNLLNKLREIQKELEAADKSARYLDVITVGRKAAEGAARMRMNMMADFAKLDATEDVEGVYPIASQIVKMYQSGKYQKVLVVYNHYVSTLVQKATVKQLLPLTSDAMLGSDPASSAKDVDSRLRGNDRGGVKYEFEPSPEAVINHLIPRILESQLYQAILESDASEHSARMIMMKNATDAAGDLISDLTLTFNQLRQNKITTELSEITAGKIALEK